jgi:hypothetical protein
VDKYSKRLVGTLLGNKVFDLPLLTPMALAVYAITWRLAQTILVGSVQNFDGGDEED